MQVYDYFKLLKREHKKIMSKCKYVYLYCEDNKVTEVRFRTKREHQSKHVKNVPRVEIFAKENQPKKMIVQVVCGPNWDANIFDNTY